MRLKDLGTVTTVIKQIGAGAKDIELVKKAIDGLTLSNKAAVLTTTNLTKSEQISLLTSRTVTKEEAKQALATAASSAANVAETATTKGLTAAKTALTSATKGLWAVMKAHPLMAIVAVAGVAISIFSKMRESAEKLSEKVGEVTSEYKEQISALVGGKNAFETEAARYAQLSKGVDALGKNVSLTADEYAEYKEVANSIASQIPSLVVGFDSQGNAILSCRGNVEKLTEAYNDLIIAANESVLAEGKDIFKDFRNKTKDSKNDDFGSRLFGKSEDFTYDTYIALNSILSGDNLDDAIKKWATVGSTNAVSINSALKKTGLEQKKN